VKEDELDHLVDAVQDPPVKIVLKKENEPEKDASLHGPLIYLTPSFHKPSRKIISAIKIIYKLII
jgi:hypothetical protein